MTKKKGAVILIALILGWGFTNISSAGMSNGWIYQTSYPTDNTLLAVKFITPQKGWVVGEHGIVLYTEDGGDNWEAQESGTEEDLKSVTFVNDKKGWVVGNRGVIIHTEDGGKKWTKQGGNRVPLNIVFFLNEKEGWVGGSMGFLLHTLDGGKNWKNHNSGAKADIAWIFFLNSKAGWILSNAVVYRTKNGGKNWEASELPPVKFPFPRGLAKPTDHGWQGSIHFLDEKKGWATVGIWFIFSTKDGGKSWKADEIANSVDRIAFTDERHGCIAGTNILCTEDGGTSWKERLGVKPRESTTGDYLVAIWGLSITDKSTGLAVGNNGQIWKTENGGKSWKIKRGYGSFNYIVDSKIAWGKTLRNNIAKTEDGGKTWSVQKTFERPVILDYFFITPDIGWVVGYEEGRDRYKGPLVLKYFILHTNDGGKTWITQYERSGGELGISDDLLDVFFINPDIGWTVGRNGLILHTKNGGKDWIRQKSGSKSELWRVQFVNANNGWIIANKTIEGSGTSTILYTEDGGDHWKVRWKKKTDWMWLDELHFIDEKNGWISGVNNATSGDSILIQTVDGGKTWLEKEFNDIYFDKTYFFDKNRGVIFSEKGQMLITRDGGKTWEKQRTPIRKFPWHISELFIEKNS